MSQKNNLNPNKSKKWGTKERNILSPKLDVVFQILFGEVGSENITKDFLSSILSEKINEISLDENIVLRRGIPREKMGIVDVLAKINNNEYCNIEMQVINKKNLIKRMLFYWSKQYTKGIKQGEDYQELKRTIVILIADFEIEEIKELEYHSEWKIIELKHRKYILTEDLEFHIIELPKMYKLSKTEKNNKLIEWLYFLNNPESKEVQEYMKSNENMKQAKEKLDGLSDDKVVARLAELREKAILDEREAEYTGYFKGKEEGRKDREKEIAKKMKEMQIPLEQIEKATGLTKEEIEKL